MAARTTNLPGLDLGRLQDFLGRTRPGLLQGALTGRLLAGGRSNLTYVVGDGTSELVLRRPPLGHVLATAHDMAREHRVMSALDGSTVPVPQPVLLCTDPDVLGAPFYLMQKVDGVVYRSGAETARLGSDDKRVLADNLVDVLADLHAIDPADVGLGDFGRPQGYLARQVQRWAGQLERSRSREVAGVDALRDRLAATVPESTRTAIVHGDYRLDNVVTGADLSIRAVLDWEMATVGDPLADVGLMLVYWDGLGAMENPIVDGVGVRAGFPAGQALADRYAARAGGLGNLDWYLGFGYFKLAAVLEGIHYRFVHGQTVGDGFADIGRLVEPLAARGLDAVESVSAR